MQRCVLLAFLNNDIEVLSAALQTVEARSVTWWMLQSAAQWAENEKEIGEEQSLRIFFIVIAFCTEQRRCHDVCDWKLRRNYVKQIRTLLWCLQEQFLSQRASQWSKNKPVTCHLFKKCDLTALDRRPSRENEFLFSLWYCIVVSLSPAF